MRIVLIFLILLFFTHSETFALRVSKQTYQRRLQESKIKKELHTLQASIFKVYLEKEISASLKQGLQRIIESAINTVSYDFGYKPQGPVELILLEGSTYDSIDDPRIASGGFYQNKKIRMNFDYSIEEKKLLTDFERVFRHELTHLVIGSIDGGRTPRWLDEGLAEYEERKRSERKRGEGRAFYQKLKKKGEAPNPEEFFKRNVLQQYTNYGSQFYEHSYIISKYIVETYGFPKLREVFSGIKMGKSFKVIFKETYGKTPEEIAMLAYTS